MPSARPKPKPDPKPALDLTELRQTPGFMVRLLQLKFFEAFYAHFAALGLSPASYAVLAIIRDNPGVAPSTVATVLNVRLPNLIKLLNALETAGVIRRVRSKADRRAIELLLTAKGTKLMDEAIRITRPYNRAMLAPLTAPEQERLLDMLNRLVPL